MLPLQQAYEVKESVLEYIKATFRFKDKDVYDEFYRFIENKNNGLFKGPYVSLKTPFVKATKEEMEHIPLDIVPKFTPHRHQLQAFEKLTTHGNHNPEPTLLTTGTGSGKTECFLYPVLDYCYQCNKDGIRKGVKVLIMYPMNALATDQAKRIAETIWNDPRLRGKVTAGLFIGEGENPQNYSTVMGPDKVIENRATIVDTAPDILLTNFKMLDYGLMQQKYMPLWTGNINSDDPALRFIILDELHTYDGAQGTDVANLIRRLKLKLDLPANRLCPVGTSATIGNGVDSKKDLCAYASDVFGEFFQEHDVIEEHRVAVDDLFSGTLTPELPSGEQLSKCEFGDDDNVASYLKRIREIWLPEFGDSPQEIASGLNQLLITRDLLHVTAPHIITVDRLSRELAKENAAFKELSPELRVLAIESILALVAQAKDEFGFPVLYLQIQLWQRELSGVLRYVQEKPEFTWRDKLSNDGRVALPMYFCRDCGASGWLSKRLQTDNHFSANISDINVAFIQEHDKDVCLLNLDTPRHEPIEEYLGTDNDNASMFIHTRDLSDANHDDVDALKIRMCRKLTKPKQGQKQKFMSNCPECNSDSLTMVGGRTSTLSSVAISQVMSSDFDSSDDSKRKILTFTNSVQDAAHQAGFYEARTFRFLFRQSIQQYLKTQSQPISLAELQAGFKKYWKEQLPNDEYYYKLLPSDIAARIDLDKNYRDSSGHTFIDSFKKEFDLRMDWEICSEFGLRALIGRTLEKTGTSGTFFSREMLEGIFDNMKYWLINNNLEFITSDAFCHFLNGLLHRMRTRGGINHPYLDKFRAEKLKPYELNWNFSNEHFLNKKFNSSVRYPKLVATNAENSLEIVDVTKVARNANWFYTYCRMCFEPLRNIGDTDLYPLVVNDFYIELFNVLYRANVVSCKRSRTGVETYAIRPEAIMVEPKVKHIKCDHCQSIQYVAASDQLTPGTHCIEYKCLDGKYSEIVTPEFNYYLAVYNRKKSPRIYASEHNGLLERQEREEVERSFKEHPNFNSVNALSATSTLEMGIDIGDLNVMGNTSIPPKPSNFLQRVGRAGRKSGSALVLNYAHSDARHDMFYYDEPLEMMEGEVQTPGCFLEAKDILRRHFYAYCIDSWTSANSAHKLPDQIRTLNLTEASLVDENFFINRIATYIKNNKEWLMGRFRKKYPPKTLPVLDALFETIENGNFFLTIEQEFKKLADHLQMLRDERAELEQQKSRLQPNDIALEDIKERIKGVNVQLGLLLKQLVIEYMTNAGLLPNYAFPETGVKLEASIYTPKARGDLAQNSIEPKAIEIVRPASQGIRELAPGNFFYTHKSRLPISGISTFGWNDSVQKFRYCSNCDCIADETMPEFNENVCPKCGDMSWGANKHQYMKFLSSRSNPSREETALEDNSDEREMERFHVMKHFNFHNSGNVVSYGLKDVGFGIEFCKDVEIVEVNYGRQDIYQQRTQVNRDINIPANGFIVCRSCGKVILDNPNTVKQEDLHYKYCKHKDVPYPPGPDEKNIFEELYLYRRLNTESIKVLLPVQFVDTQSSMQLFKAGIELGMRHYYKSSPDHIRIDTYQEYNEATQNFDNYLVIYDSIPGGTGYLAKLYNTSEFSELIKLAYKHIRDCKCQNEGKDGCYHCILTYGNQMGKEQISRSKAELLFEKIVERLDQWETIPGSIGTITQSGVIEDSELELKFISIIKQMAATKGWHFEKVIDVDHYFYELFIKDDNLECKYSIRPQYRLGSRDGINAYTISDFQFICNYARTGDSEIDVSTVPQWAVYLDGYRYHAFGENIRLYDDFKKREAIRHKTGTPMFTWTLTWKDLSLTEPDSDGKLGTDELYLQSIGELEQLYNNDIHKCRNSLERFIYVLMHPKMTNVKNDIYNYMMCHLFPQQHRYICSYDDIEDALENNATDNLFSQIAQDDLAQGHFFARTDLPPIITALMVGSSSWCAVDFFAESYQDDTVLNSALDVSMRCILKLKQGLQSVDQLEWEKFWRLYNLLQFFNHTDSQTQETINYDEIMMFFPGLEDIVKQLLDNGIDFDHDGGFCLEDEDGVMLAEADLGFADKKIVINPIDTDSRNAFIGAGYTIVSPEDFNIELVK